MTDLVLRNRNKSSTHLGKPGSKEQDLNRKYDGSCLRIDTTDRVHRDYAAHFFRWGFARTFVEGGKSSVLDIGCGVAQPFAKVLRGTLGGYPKKYVGVDINAMKKKVMSSWCTTFDQFDFCERGLELIGRGPFDVITCFEVIEHMHPPSGAKLLRNARKLLAPDGRFLLSTPVYDRRKMAANHLHEWEMEELRAAILGAGLKVIDRFGTFASWNAIKKVATGQELALAKDLMRYYSSEVISCFLAPRYPDASRNCCWVLGHQ